MGKRNKYKEIIKQLEMLNRRLQENISILEGKVSLLEKKSSHLEEDNAYLKFQIKELQDKIYKKKRNKDDPPSGEGKPPKKKKKRGAPFGHIGWFRKKPKKIDRVEEVKLDKCPECGSDNLKEYEETEDHIQEDIILPRVETTCYRKHQYYCKGCKQAVEGRGKQELPHSYIGPVAKSLAIYLKFDVKVSDRDIKKVFKNLFHLNVTPSAIPGFRNQLRRYCQSSYEEILKRIRESDLAYVDETGWRSDGVPLWLWNYSNKKVSLSNICEGRGQKDLEQVLGEKFGGILISDFLSAYNKIKAKAKQRCLVHLLRELKRVQECLCDDKTVQRFCNRLKKIIKQAIELAKQRSAKKISLKIFKKKRKRLEDSLEDLNFIDPQHRILQRFVKRLNRHRQEILTFLYHPEVSHHNNYAEQQIRPNVILRKIIFGNRSQKGIENHNVLMSIIQTAKLNKLDPFKVLQSLLFNFDKPKAFTSLIPP